MEPHFYQRAMINLQKAAFRTKENINLSDFTECTAKDVTVVSEPFPHFVVDNFFKPEVYQAYCDIFSKIFERGLTKGTEDVTKFHAFDIDYDGYLVGLVPTIDPGNPMRLFYSLEWNNFFSKIFHQFTTFETTFALHHHPPGDRTGFVHHDFADKYFDPKYRLANGVVTEEKKEKDFSRRRVISLLIYLNNPEWKEGDGGETGIYAPDRITLLKTVPPVNNRLFAFQTSPKSFHAFQENKTVRNSMVQWFHAPEELL